MKKVTRDYTLAAIDALAKSNNTGKPLRFVYVSGIAVSRDLNQDWDALKAFIAPEYVKLRVSLVSSSSFFFVLNINVLTSLVHIGSRTSQLRGKLRRENRNLLCETRLY